MVFQRAVAELVVKPLGMSLCIAAKAGLCLVRSEDRFHGNKAHMISLIACHQNPTEF